MTVPERLYRWNCWYDRLPQEWRFQVILWPVVAAGFLNMLLTLAIGFPFGLLVLLAVLCVAAVRFPYAAGWIAPAADDPSGEPAARKFEIPGADWLIDLNQRYDAMPHARRFWIFPAILLIAGAINMALTIGTGFSFGLLFLLALLALIAFRAPYVAGMLKSPSSLAAPVLSEQASPRIAHDPSPIISAEPRSVEPEMVPPAARREGETSDLGEPVVPSVDVKAAPPEDDQDSMAVPPPPAPPATHREMQASDLGEPVAPSIDVKAAPPKDDHDSMAVPPPPAPPATGREVQASDLGEPVASSIDVKAAPPEGNHDSVAVASSPANEMPLESAVKPDKDDAANDQPTPPRNRSRKPDRTQ